MPNLAVTYSAPTGKTVVNLSGTITADAQFIQQPVAGEQIVFNSGTSLTVSPQLVIAGDTGTYDVWHVKLNGEVEKLSYFIGSIYTNVTFSAGANYTTATIANQFDPYVFQNWPQGEPQPGWQLTTLTADGYFDAGGNFYSEVEKVLPCWVTDLNGLVTRITIDSTLIGVATDITPDSFSFTDLTGQALSTQFESNSIQVLGVTDGLDITVSVTGGEYAISTDGGTSYGAWTSAAGVVRLNNVIKLRNTSSGSYSTDVNTTLTVGGVSDTWTIGTLSVDLIPDQFAFNDQTGTIPSTQYESNSVQIIGVTPAEDVPVSVTGGEYAISTDGGTSYGAWTSAAGVIQLGNLIKLRATTSADAGAFSDIVLDVGSTTDTWRLSNITPDLVPDAFLFTDIENAELNTVYESNSIQVLGVTAGFDVPVSITGGEYAISTDAGATWGAFTDQSGTARINNLIKLRTTSSAVSDGSVAVTLNAGGITDTWQISNQSEVVGFDFWAQVVSETNVLSAYRFGVKDYQSKRLFWLNLEDVLNNFAITEFSIDPDNDIPETGPSIVSSGLNASQVTDYEGNTYAANTLIGVSISGGVNGESYIIPVQFTLSSEETGERNFVLNVTDY
jgi:hypothetical protein